MTNEEIQKHIEQNCRNAHGEPMMDEQAFYEGAKWMRDQALRIQDASGSCFGRISESVFCDLKSLDDLITKMGTTKDGYKISGVGEPDGFKSRLKSFKEFLKKELPEFTEEDILKFDKHFQKFRKIYEWDGAGYFLNAMEYEARNNSR